MELNAIGESYSSHSHSHSHSQVCNRDELFQFQVHSSKGNYLQDFHHLDHFHLTNLPLNYPVNLEDQSPCCFDSNFNVPYSYYTWPARADQVMDNFQTGECYSSFQFHPLNNNLHEAVKQQPAVNFVVPDEVSCITSANAAALPSLIRAYNKGRKKPNVIKGQWTVEEDRLLVELVEQYGVRKWSHIAQMLPGRIGKQCRERWHNHLRPDIKKDTWSEEEDQVLIQAHTEIGNKWAEIAKRLPGRTENSIKNHWNATKRRQYSKRKCRSKLPRCSLLQDYIKSLNLDHSSSTPCQRRSSVAVKNDQMKPAGADGVVPDFDFNGDLEFCFDDKMFDQEAGLVDGDFSEIEKLNYCASYVIESKYEADKMAAAAAAAATTGEFEVKKELDLVEMITQVNEVNKIKMK